MAMTREEAYGVLGLPTGVGIRQVVDRYKHLGKEYHPQHNPNNSEAEKKFSRLSIAYATINGNRKKAAKMSLEQMLRQFQEVFFQRHFDTLNGSADSSSSESEEEEDIDGDDEDDDETPYSRQSNRTSDTSNDRKSEDAGLNDNTEEEKERKKAEKRRQKKKRQRERKKLEKQNGKNQQPQVSVRSRSPEMIKKKQVETKITEASSDEDEGEFDANAAFFTKVVNKKKNKQPEISSKKEKKEKGAIPPKPEELEDPEPRVLRSRQLAIRGNEMAQVEQYMAAVELFTEAISLDPRDFRFFGNRSYCYDRMEQFEKALKDAERAIELNPSWAKGYFRKGRALHGLKHYMDAEKSFCEVLRLDPHCNDAVQELFNVRIFHLMEMGFSKQVAEDAIKKHGSVQEALESLISGGVGDLSLGGEAYQSDDEFQVHQSRHAQQQKLQSAQDAKMNPSNPDGLTALWVGNVLPQVSEKKLLTMFSKCGQVTSVRMLHEKYCAFINFSNKEAAGKAMQNLQGAECEGQHLLIRFPDNPITSNGNITLRKPNTSAKQGQDTSGRKTGPVNGDECYFWRTTGCTYGEKCRYKHIPDHKGLDKKPWQKS